MLGYEDLSISFLGVAEFIESGKQPFPVGAVNIFQISKFKSHFCYPALTTKDQWVFSVDRKLCTLEELKKVKIEISYSTGEKLADYSFQNMSVMEGLRPDNEEEQSDSSQHTFLLIEDRGAVITYFRVDNSILYPDTFSVQVKYEDQSYEIGKMEYQYRPAEPLTADKILAIMSNPNSKKTIQYTISCNNCRDEYKAYSSIERQKKLEKDGFVYQYDVGEKFQCTCKKLKLPLIYTKESLHGFLYLDHLDLNVSYMRRYAHNNILETAKKFENLLDKEEVEERYQKFIENHPVLLAKFYAKGVFIKPNILGKYIADFAVLTATDELVLIEIEKPGMSIFRKEGHLRADVMHAYNQVNDWLHQYAKHPLPILESLELKPEQVNNIRGVVILGRSSKEKSEDLQKHLSQPVYPNIEFLTYDELIKSMIEISRKLN